MNETNFPVDQIIQVSLFGDIVTLTPLTESELNEIYKQFIATDFEKQF